MKRFLDLIRLSLLRNRAPTGLAPDGLQSGVKEGDEAWAAAVVYSKPDSKLLTLAMGCGASEEEAVGFASANVPQGGAVLGKNTMRIVSWELVDV